MYGVTMERIRKGIYWALPLILISLFCSIVAAGAYYFSRNGGTSYIGNSTATALLVGRLSVRPPSFPLLPLVAQPPPPPDCNCACRCVIEFGDERPKPPDWNDP